MNLETATNRKKARVKLDVHDETDILLRTLAPSEDSKFGNYVMFILRDSSIFAKLMGLGECPVVFTLRDRQLKRINDKLLLSISKIDGTIAESNLVIREIISSYLDAKEPK
jgi:hypothetical protein